MTERTWQPNRKVTVAGLAGPVITAALAWALPSLPAPGVAFVAALVTAGIAYLTKSPTPNLRQE